MLPIKVPRKPTKCHNCNNTTVVEISYGEPKEEAYKLSEEGKLVLGGCVIMIGKSADWQYIQCETTYIKIPKHNE